MHFQSRAYREAAPALAAAAREAQEFLKGLPERRVFPPEQSLRRVADFSPDLPRDGKPSTEIIETLLDLSRDGVVATPGPRYFGYVTGGAVPAAAAASWLAAA